MIKSDDNENCIANNDASVYAAFSKYMFLLVKPTSAMKNIHFHYP